MLKTEYQTIISAYKTLFRVYDAEKKERGAASNEIKKALAALADVLNKYEKE